MEMVVHRGNLGYQQSGTAFAYIGRTCRIGWPANPERRRSSASSRARRTTKRNCREFQRKHAWFIAFAPADAPEIAVSVLVENGGGGSAFAAPVARQVIDAYLLPHAGDAMSSRDYRPVVTRRRPAGRSHG